MSSADLLDDGFPHGTKAGYDLGCHSGGICAGKATGQTCKQAASRYRMDRAYKRLVDSGAPVEEQAMPEGGALPVTPKRPVQNPSGRLQEVRPPNTPEPLHTVPAVVEPSPVPVVAAAKRMGPKPTPVADRLVGKHGTTTGYNYGCRDDCPGGPDGKTCREANRDGVNRRARAKRAALAAAATPPAETPEPSNGTEPAVNETSKTAKVAENMPANMPAPTESVPDETMALAEDKPNVAPEHTPELEETLAELREKHPPIEPQYSISGTATSEVTVQTARPLNDQVRDLGTMSPEQARDALGLPDPEETHALAEDTPAPENTTPTPTGPTDPWTGHPLTNPDDDPQRSPHPVTPFDRRHRHTLAQHMLFPLLRAIWLEAFEAGRSEQ